MFRKTREKSPYFLLAVDFGYSLLAGVGLFGYLGYWLDGRFGTTPWLMIAGGALGLATAFNGLFRRLNVLEGGRKARRKQDKEKGPDPRP
ncbi:MAG TPA: AtpZ/AtpI family protein [Symbiobacteriaceae bacterium]|nr:AtpZ/AtpI family protein [Symbiobacteriaceae bacterium]